MQWALGKNVKRIIPYTFLGFDCEEEEKGEKKEERDIKYNKKDTFTPIFNGENGEVGNGGLTEVTSGGLSDNF